MRPLPTKTDSSCGLSLADALFLLCAAAYAWLACQGIVPLSGAGAIMDSDLQTYAQGMAGAARPEMFAADPVLHSASAANSIPNLERLLGGWLAPQEQWAVGLLRAGAIAIFVFYCGWYFLGRWLYGSPALAAMLAIACGITVWTGWGTFWGITHSDPVPRVFFGALMPFLLWLGFLALRTPWLRPAAMLAAGLAVWVHGVSALNSGAMLFMAFLFIPVAPPGRHIGNLCVCLLAFFLPVLLFLWPSLRGDSLSHEDISTLMELFAMRWQEDYSNFGSRLVNFFSPAGSVFPVLAGGLAGWLVLSFRGNSREKLVCAAARCFLLALLAVAGFCWLESRYAPDFGRAPMGHELVRGMRLLVPVAWLLVIGGIGCLAGKTARRVILAGAILAVLLVSQDRQYMAGRLALAEKTGLPIPVNEDRREADRMAELMRLIKQDVPAGEAIYCPEDAMQVRYLALRPLVHSFKDGYVHFYNKDAASARTWLRLEKLAHAEPEGWLKAWQESGAPWLLCRDNVDKTRLAGLGEIVLERNGWLLVRKKG